MKYLIIGGVAGGATVAARLRRLDEQAEIILIERGNMSRMPTADYLIILEASSVTARNSSCRPCRD